MTELLDRRLVVVTGKGGVGKTTIASALGLLGASRGKRTMVVEVGEHRRLPELYGHASRPGEETELERGLWTASVDPHRALLEWMHTQVVGRVPARLLGSSDTFQHFVAAAPGAKEVVTMAKVWDMAQAKRWRKDAGRYDLVVLDAPSTGHALALLHSPHTFASIARVGPIANQARHVSELLDDHERCGFVGVTLGTEMAVTETLELDERLHDQLGRNLHTVLVNAVLPRRFNRDELAQVEQAAADSGSPSPLALDAARAARFAQRQSGSQHSQLARLRRHHMRVSSVPFVFEPELGLDALRAIGARLGQRLP